MDSQKTLIDIASVSQRVVTTLVRYTGHKTVESFQLDKIVVGCGAVLETLNKTLLLNHGSIDDRVADWLHSAEPQECLRTLNRMESILNRKPAHGGRDFFRSSSFTHAQDSDEAIRLFQTNRIYFHFLLMPMDVWNREHESQRLRQPAWHSALRKKEEADAQSLVQLVQCTDRDATSTLQGEEVKKQGVDVEKLKKILEWLDAWNCKETHRRTALLRQPDTCTWLPNTNAFKIWRSTNDSFLWLHGKVGAGKSVLAASVIENLENTLKEGEILVLFYCDFRNQRSTSAAEVMRSLLSQLLRQFSWNVIDHGDLIDELYKQRDEGISATSDVMLLARYVSRVAQQFSQQPFIVIDALDECRDVEDLLDALIELMNGGLRLFTTSRPLQIIRDSLGALPSISLETKKHDVSADIKLHVTRALDSHRRLRIVDTSLKKEIYSILVQRADGMFRWVQCQLDILKRCMTAVRLREALNNLPSDLNTTYERILLKIDKDEEGEVVRRALEWLVAALRPLELSEIMDGLSIDLARQVIDHESRPVHGLALLDALGSLVIYDDLTDVVILSHFSVKEFLTGKFTRTKHPINQQLAHTQLVLCCMCYIIAYIKRSQRHVGYKCPARDTSSSWTYCDGYEPAGSRTIGHPETLFQSSISKSLLQYALFNGFRHLSYVSSRNLAVLRSIVNLQSYVQQHPSEWERLCHKTSCSSPPWPTLKHDLVLYILIAFAPEPLLRFYLQRAQPQLKDGTNPLIYAAYFNQIEHARTLLERGVSLNRSGWHISVPRQLLQIEVAVESLCSLDIVDLFLKAESPIPQQLFMRALDGQDSPFHGCKVARLLQSDEFCEWAANISDEELLLRALDPSKYVVSLKFQPSEEEIDIIQRRLIQTGCNPCSRFNEVSLRRAVSAGYISTVKQMLSLNVPLPHDIILQSSNLTMIRFLLSVGSDVRVTSPHEETPLHIVTSHWFPEEECLESVQVLVDAGCDPSACNLASQTPLHLATERGDICVIKYLLSLLVEPPRDILLAIPRSCTASLIRLLVSNGADVHAVAADGDTPLHLTLRSYFEDLDERMESTKLLVDAGCSPFLPNAFGQTPFDIAAGHASPMVMQYLLSLNIPPPLSALFSMYRAVTDGVFPVIQFLIDKGVDTRLACPQGSTALHRSMNASSEFECLRRVEILVNAGCDVHACNSAGETPLHTAARRGHILVMEYLLTIGVSVPSDILLALHRESILPGLFQRYSSTIRFLLDRGADAHVVDKDGKSLVHFAAMLHQEVDALETIQLLVHSGCNPSVTNSAQETPLHIAARCGHITVVDYLHSLDIPLPPDVLLQVAASNNSSNKVQMIRYLVDKGADTSFATADGNTPLHLLQGMGDMNHLECVKILIRAGSDPSARNLAGETPLHTMARNGDVTVLKYLLSQGVPLPHDILHTSTAKTICFLFGKGVDLGSVSFDDDTELMHRAIDLPYSEEACLEAARIIVGLGWDPSLRNSSGETPMHVAARRGHVSIVKYLLSQGVPLPADILFSSLPWKDKGIPGLDRAVRLTRFLICQGASVGITAQNRDTPLHLALRCDSTFDMIQITSWELIEILLNHGSDPTARNADGQTPLDLAGAQDPFLGRISCAWFGILAYSLPA